MQAVPLGGEAEHDEDAEQAGQRQADAPAE
jgi:hypothetical protein